MTFTRSLRAPLAALAAAGLLAPAALAQIAPVAIPLDAEQVVGAIPVGCTGIGQEKDNPRWSSYPLRVEAANPGGDLLGNMEIILTGKRGVELARITCAGPWIMLKPPPGTYRLEGWLPGGGLKHVFVTVTPPAHGQKIVNLVFPQS